MALQPTKKKQEVDDKNEEKQVPCIQKRQGYERDQGRKANRI